jgi:hypothetical protein
MANQILFTENNNGRLLNDFFSDVRLKRDVEEMIPGAEYDVYLTDTYLGKVTVAARRDFKFLHLSDALSYLQSGQPIKIYAGQLHELYHPEMDTEFAHVVLGWTKRHKENQLTTLHRYYQRALDYTWVPPFNFKDEQ